MLTFLIFYIVTGVATHVMMRIVYGRLYRIGAINWREDDDANNIMGTLLLWPLALIFGVIPKIWDTLKIRRDRRLTRPLVEQIKGLGLEKFDVIRIEFKCGEYRIGAFDRLYEEYPRLCWLLVRPGICYQWRRVGQVFKPVQYQVDNKSRKIRPFLPLGCDVVNLRT